MMRFLVAGFGGVSALVAALFAIAFAAPVGPVQYAALNAITGAVKYTASTGLFSAAACADLSNGGTACTAATGTSGHTLGFLDGANVFSAQQSASITTLTISTATFTPTGANNDYAITLVHASCPCTLANPSATPVAGTHGVIYVTQSSTGSDTIGTWGSSYLAPGGTSTISLSSGANAVDAIGYTVKDSTHILLYPNYTFSH